MAQDHETGTYSSPQRASIWLVAAIVTGVNPAFTNALAQTSTAYPVRPIRIVVALAAGGVADVTARLAAQKLSGPLGKPVIVENRKGGSENVIAAASGEVAFSFTGVPTALPLVTSGRLKSLAVTCPRRVSFLPDVPTVSESGLPGYAIVPWYGLSAPTGVPKDIVLRLNGLLDRTFNTPEMKASLSQQGIEVQTNSPQEYAAHIHSEIVRNAKLLKAAGVVAE